MHAIARWGRICFVSSLGIPAPQSLLDPIHYSNLQHFRLTAVGVVLDPAAKGCYKLLSFVRFTRLLPSPVCYPIPQIMPLF